MPSWDTYSSGLARAPLKNSCCMQREGGRVWEHLPSGKRRRPSMKVSKDPHSCHLFFVVCVGGRALIIGSWQLPFILLKTLTIHQISKGNWSQQNSSLMSLRSVFWTPLSRQWLLGSADSGSCHLWHWTHNIKLIATLHVSLGMASPYMWEGGLVVEERAAFVVSFHQRRSI